MRLVATDIDTEDLEAVQTHLGQPGTVVEDDDLESARNEVRLAIEAADDGDGTYEDRLTEARDHADRAAESLVAFTEHVRGLYLAGRLRIGNAYAAMVMASCRVSTDTLDEWRDWANRELADLG